MERLSRQGLLRKIAKVNRHLLYANVQGSLYIEGHMDINDVRYLYEDKGKNVNFYLEPNIEYPVLSKRLSSLNILQLAFIVDDAKNDDCDAECNRNCPCRERPIQ